MAVDAVERDDEPDTPVVVPEPDRTLLAVKEPVARMHNLKGNGTIELTPAEFSKLKARAKRTRAKLIAKCPMLNLQTEDWTSSWALQDLGNNKGRKIINYLEAGLSSGKFDERMQHDEHVKEWNLRKQYGMAHVYAWIDQDGPGKVFDAWYKKAAAERGEAWALKPEVTQGRVSIKRRTRSDIVRRILPPNPAFAT